MLNKLTNDEENQGASEMPESTSAGVNPTPASNPPQAPPAQKEERAYDPPQSNPGDPVVPTQSPVKSYSMGDLNKINYEMIVDVPIKVSVELGRSQMTVQEILSLEKGSVIELNRIAGDPVDIYVNDYLIAMGEVVVVDDNFGVRITKIVASPSILGNN